MLKTACQKLQCRTKVINMVPHVLGRVGATVSEWRDVVTSNATCQKQVAGQTLFWHISSETFTQSRLFPKFSAWSSVMMTELLLKLVIWKKDGEPGGFWKNIQEEIGI